MNENEKLFYSLPNPPSKKGKGVGTENEAKENPIPDENAHENAPHPSFDLPENIKDALRWCRKLSEEERTIADEKRRKIEEIMQRNGAYADQYKEVLKLLKLDSYLVALQYNPDYASEDVQKFGVDKFCALLEEEVELLSNKCNQDLYFLHQMWEAYPELNVGWVLLNIKSKLDEKGIKIDAKFKNTGEWPEGSKGEICKVVSVDYLKNLVTCTFEGARDPNQKWGLSPDSLGLIEDGK